MFKCLVKPVLLYECETWRMNATPISQIESQMRNCGTELAKDQWRKILSTDTEPTGEEEERKTKKHLEEGG